MYKKLSGSYKLTKYTENTCGYQEQTRYNLGSYTVDSTYYFRSTTLTQVKSVDPRSMKNNLELKVHTRSIYKQLKIKVHTYKYTQTTKVKSTN